MQWCGVKEDFPPEACARGPSASGGDPPLAEVPVRVRAARPSGNCIDFLKISVLASLAVLWREGQTGKGIRRYFPFVFPVPENNSVPQAAVRRKFLAAINLCFRFFPFGFYIVRLFQ
jgi:hypothetical protein